MRVYRPETELTGWLRALRRNRSGNTLAMMAAFLVPISALAGSAIDIARLYVVKVRLQQACDAGVLAGRKFMSDASTLDAPAALQAQNFFANNFQASWMRTNAVTFTPVKTADNQVAGTASANVPMTIMKMFGSPDITLNATCEARYDVADSDIMMVLDTTGSMACAPAETGGCSQGQNTYTRSDGTTGYGVTEKSSSKIKSLRAAVLSFYDTMVSNADPNTKIRYGFVPYTSTVNAGYQIPGNFLVRTKWTYQTRRAINDQNYGDPSDTSYTNIKNSACDAKTGRTPALGTDFQGDTLYNYTTVGEAVYRTKKSWTANNGQGANGNGTCVITAQTVVPLWRYGPAAADLTQYVTGATVDDPSKYTGATSKWQGCLEERDTTASTSFDPDNLPPDLDPDLTPTNDSTKWRPMWPDQIYDRSGTTTYDLPDWYLPPKAPGNGYTNYYSYFPNVGGDPNMLAGGYVSCGAPVSRLAQMSKSDITNYLNAPEFRPLGGTYHDTGMIWGTRFISPSGPFQSDTAAWPNRQTPNRNIIFMTDGDMSPNYQIYGMYGIERNDKRVSAGDFSSLTDRHNARFLAECQAAKDRNITVWVVAFGQTLTAELNACATAPASDHAFFASNSTQLNDAFATIAKQVASLRISK